MYKEAYFKHRLLNTNNGVKTHYPLFGPRRISPYRLYLVQYQSPSIKESD
jgi:hypothetical protein